MRNKLFVLWGSSGHAKVLRSLIALNGGTVVATFDNNAAATAIDNIPLFVGESGFLQWRQSITAPAVYRALIAIGGTRGRDRLALQNRLQQHGIQIATVCHPDASVDVTASIGCGSQVLAQTVVAAEVNVGQNCIINHRASIDHECTLGDGVHVAPGATLCGLVDVGDCAFIGAGAVVLPRLRIGANAVVGAGAVVTRDVPDNVTVLGNPARVWKRREQ